MKKMFKYPLQGGKTRLQLPKDAVIRHVDYQHGDFQVWVEVPLGATTAERVIRMIPTGGDVDENWTYINTVLIQNGSLVFHFYEE